MATTENMGLMTYVDASGNKLLLYPITKPECVDGLPELLAGKAPAGYGYGGVPEYIVGYANFQALLDNLLSKMEAKEVRQIVFNDTSLDPRNWRGTLFKGQDGYATLIGNTYNGTIAQKCLNEGTWSEWEWVNPPMVPGVEYLTTERWNGSRVYTQLFHIGGFTGSMAKALANGYRSVVRICGTVNYGSYNLKLDDSKIHTKIDPGGGYVYIQVDMGSETCTDCWIQAWYI